MAGTRALSRTAAAPARSATRRTYGDGLAGIAFVLPAAILLIALLLYPLIDDVRLSLSHVSPGINDSFVGLHNYRAVFVDPDFWHSVLVTLRYSITALVIEFVLGFGLALMMTRIVRGGGVLRTLVLIPTMLTPSVAALNFRNLLNYDSGMINYLLGLVGVHQRAWLADSGWSFAALVLTDVWRSTPFFVLVLGAGLLALAPDVMEAADLDGANGWRKFLHVQVPMLVPLILVTVLFRVIDLFRTFDTVLTLTGGGPGNATNVASMQIYNDMYVGQYTSYAATEAVVFLLLTLVVSVFIVRLMRPQG